MDRRGFLKLTTISGTGAALSGCGSPGDSLIRFVPDEERVPGVAEWKPSVCPLCAAGCGLSVRVMEADVETVRNGQAGIVRMGVAKKLEGASTHPINGGALCARGQAGLQMTFHPDRLIQPLRRSGPRQGGGFEPISWEQAIKEVVTQLDALVATGQQRALAFITAGRRTHRQALIDQFAEKFGAPPPIAHELFGDEVLRRANAISFGREQLPTVDLANTRYLLSFGADFLDTWNSPVAQSLAYGQMRQGRKGTRGAFVQVEARMTLTGASADEWIPTVPGTEGILALGLAHVILRDKLVSSAPIPRTFSLIEGLADGLVDYAPARVADWTKVSVSRIERLAHDFAERRPSAAVIGGPPLAHTNGLASAVAVNVLNALVGTIDQPGGIFFTPAIARPTATRRGRFETFIDEIRSGKEKVQVLFIDGVNPAFTTPAAWDVPEALGQISFVVSFGSFIDETSAVADLVLPDHSFLESWVEALPESGSRVAVASVAAPAMKPLFQTRATPDVLLEVAHALARPLDLPWRSFDGMLQDSFEVLGPEAWATSLAQGGWWGDQPVAVAPRLREGGDGRVPASVTLAMPAYAGDVSEYPFHFLPYPSTTFLDGSLAHLPWLQELPDPMTTAMWSTWVEINTTTANRLGIRLGDVVEVSSHVGLLRAPAFVSPAIAPDVVAMPTGQGHRMFGRYASGRGANPISLLSPVRVESIGALAWAATRVKVARVSGPDGGLILFSAGGQLREHRNPMEHR
jgi:anaerobic selenocysteine-containing dehydrogenase